MELSDAICSGGSTFESNQPNIILQLNCLRFHKRLCNKGLSGKSPARWQEEEEACGSHQPVVSTYG